MSRFRRLLPYGFGVLFVGLLVVALWPRPIPIEIAIATMGPLRVTVNEEGKTRIRQRYLVAAPVAGQLRRIPFKPGAAVEAERTMVALIEPVTPDLLDDRRRTLAEARRATALARVEKARADDRFALSELERSERLFQDKTISVQQLEQAQWRAASAAKELVAAEGELRQAEAELLPAPSAKDRNFEPRQEPDIVQVQAPATGRVLHVFEESARVVAAGTPLLEIGDPADLEVVVEVLSRDGARIAPGTRVELEHWGGPDPLGARVRWVEPAAFTKISALGVEEQRVNVVADITDPREAWTGLGDNFRVEARIVLWETNRTLTVPSGALFRRGDQWSAFRVENGRASLRPVQVGQIGERQIEVLGGLNEGDPVILYPGDKIRAGQRVRRIEM